jgi:hypothetical protein
MQRLAPFVAFRYDAFMGFVMALVWGVHYLTMAYYAPDPAKVQQLGLFYYLIPGAIIAFGVGYLIDGGRITQLPYPK